MWVLVALALAGSEPGAPDPEAMLRPGWESGGGGTMQSTLQVGWLVWRHAISPGDGPRCPLRPTCSGYARQAFARDGAGGYVLTFDRLLRDSNPQRYPVAPDGLHYLDPLDDHPPAGELLLGGYCRGQRRDGAQLCL